MRYAHLDECPAQRLLNRAPRIGMGHPLPNRQCQIRPQAIITPMVAEAALHKESPPARLPERRSNSSYQFRTGIECRHRNVRREITARSPDSADPNQLCASHKPAPKSRTIRLHCRPRSRPSRTHSGGGTKSDVPGMAPGSVGPFRPTLPIQNPGACRDTDRAGTGHSQGSCGC